MQSWQLGLLGNGCTPISLSVRIVLTPLLCCSRIPGEWNALRQSLLSNRNLAQAGITAGLVPYIHCAAGTVPSNNMIILIATAIEAIVGAVHIDGGDDAADSVMETLGLTGPLLSQVPYHPP
jgi:hypothetical protein